MTIIKNVFSSDWHVNNTPIIIDNRYAVTENFKEMFISYFSAIKNYYNSRTTKPIFKSVQFQLEFKYYIISVTGKEKKIC